MSASAMQPQPDRSQQQQAAAAAAEAERLRRLAVERKRQQEAAEIEAAAVAEAERQRRLADERKCQEAAEMQKRKRTAQRIQEIQKALHPTFWALPHTRKVMDSLKVQTEEPESLSAEGRGKCQQMIHFLSAVRQSNVESQAALTIHKTATGAVIHIADSEGTSVFIEAPSEIDPVEVARQLLKNLRKGLETAIGSCDPVTIFNGECRAVNFKTIFEKKLLLRTQSSSADGLAERIIALKSMTPISEESATIVDGIPSDPAETSRVFGNAQLADEWSQIASRWQQATQRTGFSATIGSKQGVLSALQSKKHVVILIAHADSTELRLPSPPPTGSSVFLNDLEEIKEQISRNKPVVYMFCCESARFDGTQNWASEFLKHGAAAVYAPQDKIETQQTRRLYESFLRGGRNLGPLAATYQAEQETGCRELEMWIG